MDLANLENFKSFFDFFFQNLKFEKLLCRRSGASVIADAAANAGAVELHARLGGRPGGFQTVDGGGRSVAARMRAVIGRALRLRRAFVIAHAAGPARLRTLHRCAHPKYGFQI